jgi:hypothetical protein
VSPTLRALLVGMVIGAAVGGAGVVGVVLMAVVDQRRGRTWW